MRSKNFWLPGFQHSAFSFGKEANIESNKFSNFHIPAGILIVFLEKALSLIHIETHFNLDEMTQCNEPFTLLSPHHCKTEVINPPTGPQAIQQVLSQSAQKVPTVEKEEAKEEEDAEMKDQAASSKELNQWLVDAQGIKEESGKAPAKLLEDEGDLIRVLEPERTQKVSRRVPADKYGSRVKSLRFTESCIHFLSLSRFRRSNYSSLLLVRIGVLESIEEPVSCGVSCPSFC